MNASDIGKRFGKLLFWIFVAPILIVIDLTMMLVTFDRDRLSAIPDHLRANITVFVRRLIHPSSRVRRRDGVHGRP